MHDHVLHFHIVLIPPCRKRPFFVVHFFLLMETKPECDTCRADLSSHFLSTHFLSTLCVLRRSWSCSVLSSVDAGTLLDRMTCLMCRACMHIWVRSAGFVARIRFRLQLRAGRYPVPMTLDWSDSISYVYSRLHVQGPAVVECVEPGHTVRSDRRDRTCGGSFCESFGHSR